MGLKAFHGLHQLQDAIDNFHETLAKKTELVKAGMDPRQVDKLAEQTEELPDEFQLQTEEIRNLQSEVKLLEEDFGLVKSPILLTSAYISDALQPIFDQYGLKFRWAYSQYRLLEEAMLYGVKAQYKKDLLDYIQFNKCDNPELNAQLNLLRELEGTSQWNFIGKPTPYGRHYYMLLVPRELIGHQSGGFHIKSWDFLMEKL